MFQGGMGLDELVWWSDNSWEELDVQLRQHARVIRISLIGRKSRKNDYNYYTFIGEDAIQALRNYIPKRPVGAEAIFIIQNGQAVTKTAIKYYWFRHLKKLGIIKPRKEGPGTRYGKNLHELRDVFRTQWEKSPAAANIAEYIMGHQVDPLEYNKAFRDTKWASKEYLKALPLLQVMSSGKPFGKVDESLLEEQTRTIEVLRTEVARLRALVNEREGLWREIEAIKRRLNDE
jgi:integrase